MIQRIATAAAPGQGVIGRKDAAQKGDQRNALTTVGAKPIDIPPRIAILRYRSRETQSSIRLEAAIWPESAAIGRPGPG